MEKFRDTFQKRVLLSSVLLLGLPLAYGPAVYAAKPIDLNHQNVSILQSFISSPSVAAVKGAVNVKEVSRDVDFNQTLHVRVKETYSGYPVWGGEAIVHIPNGANSAKSLTGALAGAKNGDSTMDGTLYQNINPDLANAPALVFTEAQAQKAMQQAVSNYQHKVGVQSNAKDQQSHLIVYIDSANKAHWAYQVNFYVAPTEANVVPAKPVYILDAVSLQPYMQWDEVKTHGSKVNEEGIGGGFGGNKKMGKLVYDGLPGNLANLKIVRDTTSNTCFMQNADVTVKNYSGGKVMSYSCEATDADHNNVYWDADKGAINGGYSPGNDALFGGAVIKDMYLKWYGLQVLTQNGKPMMLNMVVHVPRYDNAYWDGTKMTFGDGASMFYPLTSLGVAAHEVSHGFTEQHSGLVYSGQSGGMNEAFSDMAAQAAEFYAYGKNSWQIGPEIFKKEGQALRYMDQPSKDGRSIDTADQYNSGLDVHYSSGVYNRLFYLIGTSENWDPKKAFDVMVQANRNYWTANTTFSKGGCGVIKAAKDHNYDVDAVKVALATVKIDISTC